MNGGNSEYFLFRHAAFYIESEKFFFLIDPFISDNPLCNKTPEDFSSVDIIFITHGHGDHIGNAIEIAKANNATIITNFEIANYLSAKQVKVHPMHVGGTTTFDFGKVKMTPAIHGSDISTDSGILGGFVIEIENNKIYHAGDTGLTLDMKLLKDLQIDIAMLPIGGNFTMDIEDALRALKMTQPKVAIPMHYNTFDLIKANPSVFKEKATTDVKIIEANETITLLKKIYYFNSLF